MDFGDGDDLMWHGLACPPLEDYAFNFDNTFTPDNIIDDLLFEIKEKDNNKHIVTKYFKEDQALDKMDGRAKFAVQQPVKDVAVADKKRKADHDFTLEGRFTKKPCPRRYGNHGKGKGLKFLNFSEAEIKAFLGETEEEAVEKNDKKRNFMDYFIVSFEKNELARFWNHIVRHEIYVHKSHEIFPFFPYPKMAIKHKKEDIMIRQTANNFKLRLKKRLTLQRKLATTVLNPLNKDHRARISDLASAPRAPNQAHTTLVGTRITDEDQYYNSFRILYIQQNKRH
ncbi:hypothetical protein AG4045_028470 [Apium graveolens]|uniref:Uncharacterized protein n=1 Tax=Apium graveolens TaxID=4045 RepID=A0A6L5BCV8_APIGR|nr:hypothetical protein AG4045_028470 [Apium graveolens]